jgi:starch phosphorylase
MSIVQRYLHLKSLSPEERKSVVPKVVFFAGKAAPACMSLLALFPTPTSF